MMFTITKHIRTVFVALAVLLAADKAGAQGGSIFFGSDRATVAEMIRAIEEQTDFLFSYNKSHLDVSRTVTLPGRTLSLQQALDGMVAGANLKYVVHKNYIAIVPEVAAPRPQVRRQIPPRTSDVYEQGKPVAFETGPVVRVPASPFPSAETPPEPATAKEFRSDYSPAAIYGSGDGRLPRFALKTNVLYGAAALTPNIAVEAALARRWSIEVAYSSNPWNYRAKAAGEVNRKLLHGIARAEGRYWFCERFSGHFVGLHALYSEYNVSGRSIPLLFGKDYRYKGNAWGGGIVYGYDLPLGERWNVEFTVGAGVYRMKYDRYGCLTCSVDGVPETKTWVGPSRLGVSLEFLIK